MATPLTHAERVAMARLHAFLELLPTTLDQRLASAGVTTFEHTLMMVLSESEGQRMRLSELASKTNATLPRLSRVVTVLERRGIVTRSRCAADGRATNAELTPEGVRVLRQSSELYAEAVRELILSGLERVPVGAAAPDGVTQLADLMLALLTSLDTERAGVALANPACAADPLATDNPGEPTCEAGPVLARETRSVSV